ncbi:MAG: hypothetical protein U0821_13370 [Chloroflexota bacterium]
MRPLRPLALRLSLPCFAALVAFSLWASAPASAQVFDPLRPPDLPAPRLSPDPIPSHDWRSPGFVAVIDGRLYDPQCRPLRSVGSNVPNLMYRKVARENLEWMRDHGMRWMRVMAFGHGSLSAFPDIADGRVEQRLAELLADVELFNAIHPPEQRIYVLVTLVDYYEPGIPGDQHGFDNRNWCVARVLNAPWFRRGYRYYDFVEECDGAGVVRDAPNYEVNYKPWVQRLVSIGANSPAVLGWQLGNELKAKSSPRNNIEHMEAYGWYLDWTKDMVDTIREIDKNHLIFTGAQYLAELADWPYRPVHNSVALDLRVIYQELVDQMLHSCGRYCWNVWGLTHYDLELYPIDDALMFRQAGVAVIVTETGITLGKTPEQQARYGGDRAAALRSGVDQPWQDVLGRWHSRRWGLAEQIELTGMVGIAPWGSPNPNEWADPGLDLDSTRGISQVPDSGAMWELWSNLAGTLEARNRSEGVSVACEVARSS